MAELLHPEDLPRWVPGKIVLASDQLGWCNVLIRAYEYAPSEVFVPAMRDFLLIAYREGSTSMDRKVNGQWTREFLVPGNVSLLSRAEESRWHWASDIGVIHLYIAQDALAAISAEVFDRDIADVRLRDVLKTDDPALFGGIMALAEEAKADRPGGRLFVHAVTTQLCIHILRKYADVEFRENRLPTELSPLQAKLVAEYIELNIDKPLPLRELAGVARVSASHFLRQFKRSFGTPPHCYVIERRLACAKNQLSRTALPLKDIAFKAGFSDQSHMTRMFQRNLTATPGTYRTAMRA
ncbi:helix-turn-helix transcriptional regulator [Pseudomonas sp. BF-R-19]|uniref:helix-turn-helix transcriptional regulator n=1 Tax=Pseudomonas sp. BF-R-19 TaxID=2832397 RepID=UPI001CC0BD1F|nr:AraC family transcriptional regulator [Pseudomonas sp. BF-R-19]